MATAKTVSKVTPENDGTTSQDSLPTSTADALRLIAGVLYVIDNQNKETTEPEIQEDLLAMAGWLDNHPNADRQLFLAMKEAKKKKLQKQKK